MAIDRRTRRASYLAAGAGILTAVAVLSMLAPRGDMRIPADLVLNTDGVAQLPSSCKKTSALDVRLPSQASAGPLIDVIVSAGQCGDHPVRLLIPVDNVGAIEAH